MSDPCREAFEKWAVSVGRNTALVADGNYLNHTQSEWRGWQAAWNQRADTLPDQQELVKMFEKTLPDDCDWIATAILNRIKGGRG